MGKTVSRMSRPFKNWNIEARAHKAISKEKRPSAPTYESVSRQIEAVDKMVPGYKKIASRKDVKLDENLKRVYVTSSEGSEIDTRYNPDRPLPKDNLVRESFQYGFYEPDKNEIPAGKVTMRQAIEFITKHSKDPENYTAEKVAEEYKLDAKVAADILEHYRLFNTFKEGPEELKESIAMPLSLRSGITVRFKSEEPKITPFEKVEEIEELKEQQLDRIEESGKKQEEAAEKLKKIKDK